MTATKVHRDLSRRALAIAGVVALLLHAAVLWWPVTRPATAVGEVPVVNVTFERQAATPEAIEPVNLPAPAVQSSDPVPPPPVSEPEDVTPADPPPPEPARPREAQTAISHALLMERLSELEWREPEARAGRIERSVTSPLLEGLRRPVMALGANAFDDVVLPTDVEIVDRWQSAGGVHQVVLRTPNGLTLCGRQEAADPFRPWLQMPMMFNECGGGGKRTISTPDWRKSPIRR